MPRYFVTGTDTDVGKTRVVAALATALRAAGEPTTIVKLVQTGLPPRVPGDAARAGMLAGVAYLEFARFAKAAGPWSAAIAQGVPPAKASQLAYALDAVKGTIVAEGAGGLMVPLNDGEHFGHVAAMAGLETILTVGLRLGCINHALLTLDCCRRMRIAVAGAVLVERWEAATPDYRADVTRALQGNVRIFGTLPFVAEEAASVRTGASLFSGLTPP